MKSRLLGALVGGVIAFAWSFISWDLLTWHEKSLAAFDTQDAVGQAVLLHSPHSGIYLYPGIPGFESMTAEQKKAAEQDQFKKMQTGGTVFAVVRLEGFKNYGSALAIQFLSQLLTAFIFVSLLSQTKGLSYWCGVLFFTLAGLAAGIFMEVPNFTWWGFPAGYTVVNIADAAITWFLAGLFISKIMRPKAA